MLRLVWLVGMSRTPENEPAKELSLHCFLEQPTSPQTPLDAPKSPDSPFVPSPFEGFLPGKKPSADAPTARAAAAAARQPGLPGLGSAKSGAAPDLAPQPQLVSAFAIAASCPPNFFGEFWSFQISDMVCFSCSFLVFSLPE